MNGASPDMYIIEPASIHIVIQKKILNKSGRTAVNSYKSHRLKKLQYLGIIVLRFEVDWIKTQGEIVPYNFWT